MIYNGIFKKIMFKKIELWIVALLCLLFFVVLIYFGTILKYKIEGGQRFTIIGNTALFLAELPGNLKPSTLKNNIDRFIDPSADLQVFENHADKPKYKRFIKTKREELLLLSRYDGNLKRSIVEIVDLNNFSVLHTFKPNINEINSKTDSSREEFKSLSINESPARYRIIHPLINKEGDLIFHNSTLVKINFCNKLIWVNDENLMTHSIEVDHEGNYWATNWIFPFSLSEVYVGKKYENFFDDGIQKISENGETLYEKSIAEILFENNYQSLIFGNDRNFSVDPIHLNDIQPALSDTKYWKKGDLFLSSRHRSVILHFRPETNQLINIIHGPFFNQHDIDIISEKEISIFNNNNPNTKYGDGAVLGNSEVIIYNFETKKFYQKDISIPKQ